MKKRLIALAIAGAFVAPVAMADTTIYGQANASIQSVNDGTDRVAKVSSEQSRLGFKGSEDLGGGTSAVYQIETGITLDTGADTLTNRNSFVGLSGTSWGTALLGRHDTPYKIATRSLDMFADSIADNRNMMGTGAVAAFDGRQNNVVAYISPAMGGVTIAAGYVFLNEAKTAVGDPGTAYSLAAMYGAGPLNLSAAYESHNLSHAFKDGKESAYKLGGGYTMDALAINAVYEKTSDSNLTKHDHSAFYLAGKYNVSASDAVKLAYTSAGKIGGTADTEATQWSVGYDHSLSKRTTVYALYTSVANKNGQLYSLGAASTGNSATSGPGKDPSAFALGLKHSF